MGRRLENQNERIVQRCIGFNFRQIMFFNKFPEFKADKFCRDIIDNQIKLIDPSFLKDEKAIE